MNDSAAWQDSRYGNILETIGRTPVVRINKVAPEGINLYVKCEAFNPMGSVKDAGGRDPYQFLPRWLHSR